MAATLETSSLKRKHVDGDSTTSHPKKTKRGRERKRALKAKALEQETQNNLALERGKEGGDSQWSVSEPVAGKFIDRDPIFSPDERLLMFATERAIHIYSTSTSLLVRSLESRSRGAITSYALSAIDPIVLWATTHTGFILKWDIETGEELGNWKHESQIQSIRPMASSDRKTEMFFTIDANTGFSITAHRFESKDNSATLSSSSILKSEAPLCSLKVLEERNTIAVTTLDSIYIGTLSRRVEDSQKPLRYAWREIKLKEPPVCFDLRLQTVQKKTGHSKKLKGHNSTTVDSVNVVVGGLNGCMYVYEDVLNKLDRLENPSKVIEESASFKGRAMHWHRESVGAVAWSRDGNYIISGGKETVLVLWQLDTGKKQFLPNLESPIQSIVVSPTGSSYAIRLGDNSVMVLSTSELTPTAYVAGLQSTSFSTVQNPEPQLQTLEAISEKDSGPVLNRIAAAINPKSPNHLLTAVPAYQNARGAGVGHSRASYVQDFDLSTARHESRQAIARTNAISSNLGPEGNRILEPEVMFLQPSCDGLWLATVDEWTVPMQDVKTFSAPGDPKAEFKESRLRFWLWNSTEKMWMLNTRFENPNQGDDESNAGSVLDLASSPVGTRFATIGTDSVVRIWTPRSKTSGKKLIRAGTDNLNKTSSDSAAETWWGLRYTIPLEKSMSQEPLRSVSPASAKLCFSNDASIIAVYQYFEHDPSESAVYLIDTSSGVLREIRRDFASDEDELHGLAFLERYLICLGRKAATVWNVTTFDMHAHIPLISDKLRALEMRKTPFKASRTAHRKAELYPLNHLAINLATSTFAIAVPEPLKRKAHLSTGSPLLQYKTRLLLFSPEHGSNPMFTTNFPRLTSALLSVGGLQREQSSDAEINSQKRGYIVVDSGAEIRVVVPAGSESALANRGQAKAGEDVLLANSHVESPSNQRNGVLASAPADDEESSDDEADGTIAEISKSLALTKIRDVPTMAVVRPEQLAEVFDYATHAMPPMQELFQGVLKLYAEKPTRVWKSADSPPPNDKAIEQAASGEQESASESESELESSSDNEDDD